jgi:hypothetical protein
MEEWMDGSIRVANADGRKLKEELKEATIRVANADEEVFNFDS